MKRLISHILCSIVLMMIGAVACPAQQNNFDSDIYAIRNNAIPDFRYTYDDYLQYSPAAVMLAMKACTYESRSGWGRMLTSDAFSIAIMTAAVNGLKYTVRRPRPDGSANNSFPSGHTATSFMTATLLHKEYGWRSPWFSIGAYTVASVSAVSRILNNKHWMTDLIGGAAVGISSVHLGYYLSDLIFKEKGLADSYEKPDFFYDSEAKHYVAELTFGHRHFLGSGTVKRGGVVSLSADIPIIPNVGIKARGSANSLIYKYENPSSNMYSATVGGYWNFFYAKRTELQVHASAGGAFLNDSSSSRMSTGADLTAGLGASFLLDSNFKLKLFADYEAISSPSGLPWLNSVVLGWSSSWFW